MRPCSLTFCGGGWAGWAIFSASARLLSVSPLVGPTTKTALGTGVESARAASASGPHAERTAAIASATAISTPGAVRRDVLRTPVVSGKIPASDLPERRYTAATTKVMGLPGSGPEWFRPLDTDAAGNGLSAAQVDRWGGPGSGWPALGDRRAALRLCTCPMCRWCDVHSMRGGASACSTRAHRAAAYAVRR